jgi:hypothetical protein
VTSTERYHELAEAAWRWVLDRVRYDEAGPWIPLALTDPPAEEPTWDRDGMHSGIGGLAHCLAEIARSRPWTSAEATLAQAIGARLRVRTASLTDPTYFDGLVSDIEVLALLGAPGVDACVERLLTLGPADWEHRNDATLGTGAVVHGGLVAAAAGCPRGLDLAAHAAQLLVAEAEETEAGLNWQFVPRRHVPPERLEDGHPVQMPNWSHGLAGIADVLARAGAALSDPALVDAARRGAEHLVTLADPAVLDAGGLAVPRQFPSKPDHEELTWNWCHGPAGTMSLFVALDGAGVDSVAGDPPRAWVERCLEALRRSGIPERLRPGFWDNDGRCCGTAGVGAAVIEHDRELAVAMAEALVTRAHVEGDRAYWRFVEHRNEEPLLPPGVGWMQGTAGIAGYLFQVARVLT